METYELQKLRDLPIEGVAERLGLRPDEHHKCLCPFHDDHHASLSFSRRRNTCRCFACMDRSMGCSSKRPSSCDTWACHEEREET